MPTFNSLTCPGLVHLYMTRANWPRRWTEWACATSLGRLVRDPPTRTDRIATDRGVTTRGDDGRSQRRIEPAGGDRGERAARRGDVAVALRRRVAHRGRPRGRRSR